MEPWQSWAAAVCIGGAAFWYYTKDSKYFMKAKESVSSSLPDTSITSTTRQKQDKKNVRRKDNAANADATPSYAQVAASGANAKSNGTSKKRKAGRGPAAAPLPATPVQPADQPDDNEDADTAEADKDWAKQLAARKTGVTLDSSKSTQQQGKKSQRSGNATVRQSQAETLEQPSSTANSTPMPAAGDVSDMLEPRAPGPSSIRVIGGEEKQQKPRAPRAASPTKESKKQRQNRRKAEEKKLQREDDEQQRQVMLENQRRTARESRGEPAKNGMNVASAPTTSAWTPQAQSGAKPSEVPRVVATSATTNDAPLLDTFEHDTLSTSSSNDPQTNSTTPATVASAYDPQLPSEEVQLEMLNELDQNSGWNEVPGKSKKGKKKGPTSSGAPLSPTSSTDPEANMSTSTSTENLVNGGHKPAPAAAATPKPKVNAKTNAFANGFAVLDQAPGLTPEQKGHPDDSDWAVY